MCFNTIIFFTNTHTIDKRAMCHMEDQSYKDGETFSHPSGCGLWYVYATQFMSI